MSGRPSTFIPPLGGRAVGGQDRPLLIDDVADQPGRTVEALRAPRFCSAAGARHVDVLTLAGGSSRPTV